jgi:hypothetical protein
LLAPRVAVVDQAGKIRVCGSDAGKMLLVLDDRAVTSVVSEWCANCLRGDGFVDLDAEPLRAQRLGDGIVPEDEQVVCAS